MSQVDELGEFLLDACRTASANLTLCAPFVKSAVLQRVLDATAAEVTVELFTRWRPEEVAAGVSDTGVLMLTEERGGKVMLCNRLHAKYVRFDDRTLIGSANLTATALGWAQSPNLEVLMEVPSDAPQVIELEKRLRRESIRATSDLAAEVERVAALLPRPSIPPPDEVAAATERTTTGMWCPKLREPSDLYVAYSAGPKRLSSTSAAAAAEDLAELDLPVGLGREEFNALVANRLLQAPLVRELDALLAESQRFGAVRDRLMQLLRLDREAADHAWQTTMRWLIEFLPDRYERRVANWSEIFVLRDTAGGDS